MKRCTGSVIKMDLELFILSYNPHRIHGEVYIDWVQNLSMSRLHVFVPEPIIYTREIFIDFFVCPDWVRTL